MTRRAPAADLARERSLRALDARMAALLDAGGPDLAGRTRAMLAGELDAPGMEGRKMAGPLFHDTAVNLRLPSALLARAEALAPSLADDPLLAAAGRGAGRATVLRLALARGLDALEAEFRTKRPKGRR